MNTKIGHCLNPKKGDLIISEPFLNDNNFERSVILICNHDETGTFGFIVNKPTAMTVEQILGEKWDINQLVYFGGPVQNDTLHFLHTLGEKIEGSQQVRQGLYWGGNFDQLRELVESGQVKSTQYRLFMGYSGWSEGQLDRELKENAWIVSEVYHEELFSYDPSKLWQIVLKEMGGEYKIIANYPSDPRLN